MCVHCVHKHTHYLWYLSPCCSIFFIFSAFLLCCAGVSPHPPFTNHLWKASTVQQHLTTGSDLQRWLPQHLVPFDPVYHSGCNCHLLKAFKTIKSSSALGARQYISALIRTLDCQRNRPPRANPAPRGAVPTKLIILCNHTSWNTAAAAGKYRFGVKDYNMIPVSDLHRLVLWHMWHCITLLQSLLLFVCFNTWLVCSVWGSIRVLCEMGTQLLVEHLSVLKSWPSLGQEIYQGVSSLCYALRGNRLPGAWRPLLDPVVIPRIYGDSRD